MSQSITQVNYDAAENIAKNFHQESEEIEFVYQTMLQKVDALHSDWVGEAADKFFTEMEGDLLPGIQRLAQALLTSEATLKQIMKTFYEADQETVSYYKFWGGEIAAPDDSMPPIQTYGPLGDVGNLPHKQGGGEEAPPLFFDLLSFLNSINIFSPDVTLLGAINTLLMLDNPPPIAIGFHVYVGASGVINPATIGVSDSVYVIYNLYSNELSIVNSAELAVGGAVGAETDVGVGAGFTVFYGATSNDIFNGGSYHFSFGGEAAALVGIESDVDILVLTDPESGDPAVVGVGLSAGGIGGAGISLSGSVSLPSMNDSDVILTIDGADITNLAQFPVFLTEHVSQEMYDLIVQPVISTGEGIANVVIDTAGNVISTTGNVVIDTAGNVISTTGNVALDAAGGLFNLVFTPLIGSSSSSGVIPEVTPTPTQATDALSQEASTYTPTPSYTGGQTQPTSTPAPTTSTYTPTPAPTQTSPSPTDQPQPLPVQTPSGSGES